MVRSTLSAAPLDLVVVLAYLLVATAAVGSEPDPSVGQFLVGVGLVLFVPGYAVVAALFPAQARQRDSRPPTSVLALTRAHDGVLVRERLALSFGVSVLLIPLFAVLLGALGVSLTTASTVGTVWVIVVTGTFVATVRRLALPADRRFELDAAVRGVVPDRRFSADSSTTVLTAGLCLAVVLALGAFTVAIAGPTQSMSYTSASLLTTNESGAPVASGYPENVSQGQSFPLVLRVTNNHERAATYTAVARLQRVDSGTVLSGDRVWRAERRVGANETWTATHSVRPSMAGADLRLTYFLYRGAVPADVSQSTADKVLYLRLDVSPSSDGTQVSTPTGTADNRTQVSTPTGTADGTATPTGTENGTTTPLDNRTQVSTTTATDSR